MRISDWSSDVCSSYLRLPAPPRHQGHHGRAVTLEPPRLRRLQVAKEPSTITADHQGSACVLASLDGGDPTAVTAHAIQASERAFQDVLQLGAGASDRQLDSGGLMLDGERLAPRRTCLEHTALVADAAARTVDAAQMDLDAGESGIESIDCPGQNLKIERA